MSQSSAVQWEEAIIYFHHKNAAVPAGHSTHFEKSLNQ